MKAIRRLKQEIDAAIVRHKIKCGRRKHGLPTDLKALVEEYRAISPEYAEKLEQLMYPS